MIPKIIHLCWLSGDEYPDSIKKCLYTWKKHLPDYEIWLWDTKRFDINSLLWTKQAFETKKYAFAADYIRLYALYNYGGIYMDSDVFVYKSFDDLLHLPYFIGEDYVHCFEPAIIGTEKSNPWIKEILQYYDERAFIKQDGTLDVCALPIVFRKVIGDTYIFNLIKDKTEFVMNSPNMINIFSREFFNSRDYVGAVKYPNSYCSHNFVGSWYKKEGTFKDQLKLMVPRKISNLYYEIMHRLVINKQIAHKQIPYKK